MIMPIVVSAVAPLSVRLHLVAAVAELAAVRPYTAFGSHGPGTTLRPVELVTKMNTSFPLIPSGWGDREVDLGGTGHRDLGGALAQSESHGGAYSRANLPEACLVERTGLAPHAGGAHRR